MSSGSNRRRGLIAEVLAETAQEASVAPPASPQPTRADRPAQNFAQRKIQGMAEAAKMTKKPIIRLKADECSIWSGNARDYDRLNEERLRPLIDSILAQGGNSIPALVRRTPDASKPYEVMVGTRRHWAVSWLNSNHYPDVDFTAIVDDIDDEAAFRLADVENREREDISDLERAINYKQAIQTYYGGVAQRMAERLSLPKSRLSEMLQLAELPQEIICAYADPAGIKVHHAAKLSPLLRSPGTRSPIIETASKIQAENELRVRDRLPALDAPAVLQRLLASIAPPKPARKLKPALTLADGREIGQVLKDQAREGLTIAVKPSTDLPVDEILEALRPIIENAKYRCKK